MIRVSKVALEKRTVSRRNLCDAESLSPAKPAAGIHNPEAQKFLGEIENFLSGARSKTPPKNSKLLKRAPKYNWESLNWGLSKWGLQVLVHDCINLSQFSDKSSLYKSQDTFDHDKGQKSAISGRRLHWRLSIGFFAFSPGSLCNLVRQAT